jgi:hypothetical protein
MDKNVVWKIRSLLQATNLVAIDNNKLTER